MEQAMTTVRNPLVREIEEAAQHRRYSRDGREAFALTQRIYWPRLRAALEAAEEMAQNAPCSIAAPSLWMAAKRYRAATRTEGTK